MNKENIVRRFKKGEVGIFPTDTAFGIGSRIDNVESIERIYRIRKRPKDKALLALVASVKMAKEYVEISDEVEEKLIKKYWPGGLTIILKCDENKVPEIVRAGGETLAVRLPANQELIEVIDGVGVPIVAPSANFSEGKTPLDLSEVDPDLIAQVDFVVKGMCTIKGVSTIVDGTSSPWKIIRQGVVDVDS